MVTETVKKETHGFIALLLHRKDWGRATRLVYCANVAAGVDTYFDFVDRSTSWDLLQLLRWHIIHKKGARPMSGMLFHTQDSRHLLLSRLNLKIAYPVEGGRPSITEDGP